MEKIQHRNIHTNGINIHVAEIGQGPAILFLHGFPELWYSWRHQMLYLSSRGYRAIAPDLRGFGDSDAPPCASSYTAFHIIVFLVGHDWGAVMAWYFCLIRPDRIKALVNMSVVFPPRNPKRKPLESMRAVLGDDYYICRFQVLGWIWGACHKPTTMPSWLSEDDVQYYASKFNQKGFTGGLNYYRAMDLNWELTAPWTGVQIKVPVKFIVGDVDLTYNTPGAKEYIHNGGFKRRVPFLQELVIMEGVAHFLNQEKPEETSEHIYDFIQRF
ncbi:hypothetical protein Pfo_006124 [Paulownia fortunei]|nr:hypothetical protein Pfo_006124 [Paulownia fortunei]